MYSIILKLNHENQITYMDVCYKDKVPKDYCIPIVEATMDEDESDESFLLKYHHVFGYISFECLKNIQQDYITVIITNDQ